MAVEAQRDPGGSLPGPGIFEVHIIQQVVAARSLDQVQAADALAGDLPMAGAGLLAVGTATDAVGVVLLAHQLKTAGGGLELGVGAVGGEIAGFAGIGIAGDQGRGDVRAGNADLAALRQAGTADGLTGGQVHIVGAGLAGVAGDVGDTADGEGGAVKVHAAAQLRGGVAGDGGAAEVQDNIAGVFAGLAIDSAAVTVGGVVLDGAVLNIHGHPATGVDSAALGVFGVGAGGGAAGDGSALHGEGDGVGFAGPATGFIDHGNGAAPVAGGAVLDGAALFHDQLAQGHIDGGTVAGGGAVLDGSAPAQGQLRVIGAGHKNECVFGRYILLIAVQDDVLEGQLTISHPERILSFIVVCAGLEVSRADQLIGAALLASYGDVLL